MSQVGRLYIEIGKGRKGGRFSVLCAGVIIMNDHDIKTPRFIHCLVNSVIIRVNWKYCLVLIHVLMY